MRFPGDSSNEEELLALAGHVERLGELHASVFNVGSGTRAPTLELSASDFEAAWRGNVLGGLLFAQASLKLLLRAAADAPPQGPSLLFTGATASLRGRPPFTAFASAKAGLRSLAQSLAREFGTHGVHVAHVIIDGGIDGEQVRQSAPQRVKDAGDDGLLSLDAIAETYWQLHAQHRSAWTHELDLRPSKESF